MTDSFGRWRGPDLESWLERIARPSTPVNETLPWIKPSSIVVPTTPWTDEPAGLPRRSMGSPVRPLTPGDPHHPVAP